MASKVPGYKYFKRELEEYAFCQSSLSCDAGTLLGEFTGPSLSCDAGTHLGEFTGPSLSCDAGAHLGEFTGPSLSCDAGAHLGEFTGHLYQNFNFAVAMSYWLPTID